MSQNKKFKAAFNRLAIAHPDILDKIARRIANEAECGDVQAAAFIRDTMDGKPAQQIEHTGEQVVTLRTMVTQVMRDHATLLIEHDDTKQG